MKPKTAIKINFQGKTLIHLAVEQGNLEMLKLFEEYK